MTRRAALLSLLMASACSRTNPGLPDMDDPPDLAGDPVPTDGAVATTDGATPPDGAAPVSLVVTIVLENHSYDDVVASPSNTAPLTNAPYINSLIQQYGLATNYQDSGKHPSLPNYLYMVSGDTQYPGFVDLLPTASFITGSFPVKKDNLGSQLEKAGIAWRSYQESMTAPCQLTNAGDYAPKHDPFLYFDDIQNGANDLCARTNVEYGQFAADLAAGTYRYMWLTPNLINDGHNPTGDPATGLKQADDWCKSEIPKILASAAYQAGGIIFLTWDEGEGFAPGAADHIPMIIISPRLKSAGYKSNTAYTHASYLATVEDLFGLPRLGAAANAPNLTEFFQ